MLAERVEAHAVSIVPRMGFVQVEQDGAVATVTFSNPGKKNAIPSAAWPDMEATFRSLSVTPEVRCVVVTGEGDDFSSGADVSAPPQARQEHTGWSSCARSAAPSKPSTRCPNRSSPGWQASAWAPPSTSPWAATWWWRATTPASRRSSPAAASASTAAAHGSCPAWSASTAPRSWPCWPTSSPPRRPSASVSSTGWCPAADLDATVASLAARLAAGPPLALSTTKRLLNQSAQVTLAQALEAEAQAQAVNLASRDTAEAMAAFVERRDPHFEGR